MRGILKTMFNFVTVWIWACLIAIGLVAAFAAGGCAGNDPGAQQAIDTAKSVLVGVDIAAETTAPLVVEARKLRIGQCRSKELPTDEEREACLGPLAGELAPVAARASAAYDAVLEQLDALGEALAELDRMRGAAAAVKGGE